jgi:NADP-dependent 3-hydroxy acid dehydrogenase YdfG
MMQENQQQEVVVVTGASAGLGRAIAQEFGRHGAKVALLARGEERLEQAKQEVESVGGEAMSFTVDVANAGRLEEIAAEVEQKWGSIDVWINNAMVSVLSPVKEMKPEEYKRVTEVNYLGFVYGTMAALKHMLPRDHGSIVLVGSALAYRGIPLQSAYCATKHAIQGFFDSLRAELIHDQSHVRLSMVQLPAMNTPQFNWLRSRLPHKARPMGTIYQPEVSARAIYYAAHHNVREVMVGYPTFITLYGNKLFPGIGDWYLGKTGYSGQQTQEDEDPEREDNLYNTVKGDYGAHGDFDEMAKSWSITNWLRENSTVVLSAAATVLLALWWRK